MSIPVHKKIPQGYIKEAKRYSIISVDIPEGIELGGRIMLQQVVIEQMAIDDIIYVSGLGSEVCIIGVSYTDEQVRTMIDNAKRLLGKFVDEGGDLQGNK